VGFWLRLTQLGLVAPAAAAAAPAAVAASASAAAAAAAVATTAGAGALFTRLGLIDGQGAALELLPVHSGDGLVASGVHLDEREPTAAAGVAIADDLRAQDGPVLGERLDEIVTGGVEGNVPDIQLLTHGLPHWAFGPNIKTDCAELPREKQERTSSCPPPAVQRERSGCEAIRLRRYRLHCLGGCEK